MSKYRKDLFARKGRLFKGILPTSDALMQHLKRPFYQASFSWGQLLVAHKELPDLCQWGRKDSESNIEVQWMMLPEVSEMCHVLIR